MWVRSFSTRLTSVTFALVTYFRYSALYKCTYYYYYYTFAEDKMLSFLILRKNAKIVQL